MALLLLPKEIHGEINSHLNKIESLLFNHVLYNHPLPLLADEDDIAMVVKSSLNVLSFFLPKIDGNVVNIAAKVGSLTALKYLINKGYLIDDNTATAAAFSGSLECLTYVIERGGYCDEKTYTAAVNGGSISCLKYLRSIKCPYDYSALMVVLVIKEEIEKKEFKEIEEFINNIIKEDRRGLFSLLPPFPSLSQGAFGDIFHATQLKLAMEKDSNETFK